jgi:malonyl-ACP decarboxylase
MLNYIQQYEILITGIGVTSNIGQGRTNFTSSLMEAKQNFGYLQRSGRQIGNKLFLGSEISNHIYPKDFPERLLQSASFSSCIALITLKEAWDEAKLDDYEPERIGLIVGGSNFQQRYLQQLYQKYNTKPQFFPPSLGFSFFDTDLSSLCSEYFGIKGLAYTVGGASASGQLAIIESANLLQTDQVDICIVLGALMDLSFWELQSFKALGAMGSDRFYQEPVKASRPFDKNRDGFIYGENCGAIVMEKKGIRNNPKPYARLLGWNLAMDANRNPNPSYEGELFVINQALIRSGLVNSDIDYINPHGTGSPLGDETELKALKSANLNHAFINSTKSIIGHGLSSAGAVEVIATLLQMKESILHPSLNLEQPIDDSFNWVKGKSIDHKIKRALTLNMGFGGINTALCFENYD